MVHHGSANVWRYPKAGHSTDASPSQIVPMPILDLAPIIKTLLWLWEASDWVVAVDATHEHERAAPFAGCQHVQRFVRERHDMQASRLVLLLFPGCRLKVKIGPLYPGYLAETLAGENEHSHELPPRVVEGAFCA